MSTQRGFDVIVPHQLVSSSNEDQCTHPKRSSTSDVCTKQSSETLHSERTVSRDVFGKVPQDGDDMLPIVDVLLDIGAQVSQDEIPDPMEFVREYKALSQ